jgi:hypothetical protein
MVHRPITANAKDIDPSCSPRNRGGDTGEDASQIDPARPRSTVPVLPVHGTVSSYTEDGEVIWAPFGGDDFRLENAPAIFPTSPRGTVPPAVIAMIVRTNPKNITAMKVRRYTILTPMKIKSKTSRLHAVKAPINSSDRTDEDPTKTLIPTPRISIPPLMIQSIVCSSTEEIETTRGPGGDF